MSEATLDFGNLLIEDFQLYNSKEETRLERIKKCLQNFLNELSKLPMKIIDHETVVELPEPSFLLPREKHVPKPTTETRWEKFAKLKGIQKKKKSKFAFSEEKGKYVPTWGKGSKDKPWLMEVPDNANPFDNQFEKHNNLKRQRIDENEARQLKNLGRSVKTTVNKMNEEQGKKNLKRKMVDKNDERKKSAYKSVKIASISDASMGKFSKPIEREKLRKTVAKEFNKNLPKTKPKKSSIPRKPMKNKGSRTGNKKR